MRCSSSRWRVRAFNKSSSRSIRFPFFLWARFAVSALKQRFDRADQCIAGSAQLTDSFFDDARKGFFSAQEKNHLNLAPVVPVAETFDEASLLEAVNQFHGAVVLDGETLRKRTDRGGFTLFEAA